MTDSTESFPGHCTCNAVRYRLASRPMFVHCCHCRWCQRETGGAFALNAMIEAERVEVLQGEVEIVPTPSLSGKGQKIARCPTCRPARPLSMNTTSATSCGRGRRWSAGRRYWQDAQPDLRLLVITGLVPVIHAAFVPASMLHGLPGQARQ